ncbi:hypothetical protein [uncultured Psychroserpens sp.]|uniref:hypothetical protein n=1 Tax=uncultured Psychroserpens sp. TaxID=255436 RepID=UPI00260D52C5|nr:hypothetical protein [uncultured Psychroserpens sp.]
MKFKNTLLLLTALFCFTNMNAQKIKLKKGFVLVDGEKKFEYEKGDGGTELSLFTLGKETEILFMLKNKNETVGYLDDDFKQITFINEKQKLETATYRSYPHKWFIKKLIKEKVLELDGKINSKKLNIFFSKYDENITNRTIRN